MPIGTVKTKWKNNEYKINRDPKLITKKTDFEWDDESQSVTWNKNKIKDHNDACDVQIAIYDSEDEDLFDDMRDECVDVLHDDYGFSTSEGRDIFDCVYDVLDNSVDYYFFDKLISVAELIDGFNKKMKATVRNN